MCFSRKTKSKKDRSDPTRTTPYITRNIVDRIMDPYSTYIYSHIDKTIRVIITPNPVKNIKQLDIARIGRISFKIDGTYQKQEMIILPGDTKKILLDNKWFYVTAFIWNGKKWKQLWLSRLFHASRTIHFIDRHKREADYNDNVTQSTIL